jgi:putative colanic acid biosynthesis acetyltransferase WcaF
MGVDLSRFRKTVRFPIVYRLAWSFVQCTVFRYSPRCAWAWRRVLLRLFRARVASGVRIDPTCIVYNPRNVSIGRNCWIGRANELYSVGSITIEDNVALAQHVLLYAASHDLSDPLFPTITAPIVIRSQSWLAACTFVGPGVTIGEGAVLGARSSAFRDLPPWTVCVGTPAKVIRPRILEKKE